MILRTTAASYSAIADQYDSQANETSFWGELARQAYEGMVLLPRHRLVVDVGCGTGLALSHLRSRALPSTDFVGVEPAEQMRLIAQQRMAGDTRVDLRDGRFEALPLADASVDYLYSLWAFHWVSDPEQAGAELRRVLKPDADLDLWFAGMNTGGEFARVTGNVLRGYVDVEARLRAASTMTSFDRDLVERVFSSFRTPGLTITEETATHYDTLDRHWAWQVRSEAIYSVIPPERRARFDTELRAALSALGDERGIPYTRHSFHVRYRHAARPSVAIPAWLHDGKAGEDTVASARRGAFLCTLVADSDDELRAAAEQLSVELEREDAASTPEDICAVMDGAPTGLGSHRAALVASDTGTMAGDLKILARGRTPSRGVCNEFKRRPVVAFMFTGQGSDLAGKGRDLFETCPTFRTALELCAQHANESIGGSLIDVMYHDTSRLTEDTVNKVALFALQYALANLWRSWGVHPHMVVGHSLGEYAAACIAGALTLPDAMRLVIARGRVMRDHASPGAMCAVQASIDRIQPELTRYGGGIVVSALNAPESIVLSGDAVELNALSSELTAQGIRTTSLRTAYAFHSPLMLPAVQPLREACSELAHAVPQIPFISTVDSGREAQALDAEYWVRHMLQPVEFTAAVDALERRGVSTYLEIGPGTTLTHLVAQHRSSGVRAAAHVPSLDGTPSWESLLAGLAVFHSQGGELDWEIFSPRASRRTIARGDRARDVERAATVSAWEQQLTAVPASERLRAARQLIFEEIAKLLGSPVSEIDGHRAGLMDLGLQSVQLVALARRLSAHLDQRVSETIAFSHPSVESLAHFVLEALSLEPKDEQRPAPASRHVSRDTSEPIAIVGTGCRLPGGVVDLTGLRELLEAERETVRPFPAQRSRTEGQSDSTSEGTFAPPVSLLERVAEFDAAFFGISPREAARIDPTYRLLLEVCWEALENASIVPDTLAGTETGLFVGLGASEYEARPEAADAADAHSGLGTMPSVGAGRISYVLGLRGPCFAVDTACSSSLVAIHLACQSLRSRECSVALAGGASLILSPATSAWLEDSNALSKDGRCKTFSADADGYGRGEGCGVVVLKRLDEALADGDRVLAVIRGSAINHDGASSGLTAPNGTAQEALVRRALADASCAAASVGYVEAHGTGTPLGDPIEVTALSAVYGRPRGEDPMPIGSLKANLGHLEYAAGVAGLLKVIVGLRDKRIFSHRHAQKLNPLIAWEDVGLTVARTSTPWPDWNVPRRAGLSSFGISGTNAHLIVEEAPHRAFDDAAPASTIELSRPHHGSLPVVLSAKSDAALREQAQRLREHVARHPDLSLLDLAASLATSRSHFDHRAALVARDPDELATALDDLAHARPSAAVLAQRSHHGKLAFLFTGQGSQRLGMGRELYDAFPVFRSALDAVAALLDPLLDRPLYDVLFASPDEGAAALLDQTAFAQTALFAFEVALYRLLESWGLEPDLLLGHSIGELVAAHVAGVLSLSDSCTLVAARARLMQALPSQGAMLTVRAAESDVLALLPRYQGRLDIAAVNAADAVVVSGDVDAVDDIQRHFDALGAKTSRLRVSHAFHSHHMDGMLDAFGRVAAGLTFLPPRVPIVSNVTGAIASASDLASPDYWTRHVRRSVRFFDGIQTAYAAGTRSFLELGPHGVLTALAHQSLSDDVASFSLLRKGRHDLEALAAALGGLHVHGRAIDWKAFFHSWNPRRVELPTYAFQRERFWLDAPKSRHADVASAGLVSAEHPLLGAAITLPDDASLFTARLSLEDQPWLAGHRVFGAVLLPGTAFLELAFLAAHHLELDSVDELTLEAPLVLQPKRPVRLQLSVAPPDDAGLRFFTVFTRPDDASRDATWTRHATGLLAKATASGASFDLRPWPPQGAEPLPIDDLYERLADAGLAYDGPFRGLKAVFTRGDELFAEVALPDDDALAARFNLHPALLDAALHAVAARSLQTSNSIALPFSWTCVTLRAAAASTLRVRFLSSIDSVAIDIADATGEPVARVDALSTRVVSADLLESASTNDALLRLAWNELSLAPPASAIDTAFIGSADHPFLSSAVPRFLDLDHLGRAIESGAKVPALLVLPCISSDAPSDVASSAHIATERTLLFLQAWLADDRFASSALLVLTRRAVSVLHDDDVTDLVHAPLWGLLRSAQNENPDRPIFLLDADAPLSQDLLSSVVLSPESQLALRDGRLLAPSLGPVRAKDALLPPASAEWRLDITTKGTLDNLALVPYPAAAAPLAHGQVRVAVRAAGLNFRDTLDALGMYPGDPGPLGGEGAGVVLELGPGVRDLHIGDRVMGLIPAAFAPVAVTDQRLLTKIPSHWSFLQAAAVPIVFLTAYYGLVDLAHLQNGQRVLIHAAAGGVGMAATQLARHLGAEVFGTASPGKWQTLRDRGFDDLHLASSRSLDFEPHFLRASDGQGIDVVLDCLAGEFVDASLRLLPNGGHFIEIGKTDVRDPAAVAAKHPGVQYQAFDLLDAGPDRIQQMLRELTALFERGHLEPPTINARDIRHAPRAFRALAQARSIVGKIVLTLPRSLDPNGTVLITGGTGTLGALLARHLVHHHGAKHLLLASRKGPDAPGALELQRELLDAGATVDIVACDAADRSALEALFANLSTDHPLDAVIHAAGIADDGILGSISPERLHSVLRAKLDAALHLHDLTRALDLSAFVLFSSIAGVLGNQGQANYAAANTFLDALAHQRRSLGLPAVSIDWGLWQDRSAITAHVSDNDLRRFARSGLQSLSANEGLALFDAAIGHPDAALVAARFDAAALRKHANELPRVLQALVHSRPARALASNTAHPTSLVERLLPVPTQDRHAALLDLVRPHVATVLGIAAHTAIDPRRPLKELGLDSLMAVEIRNRIAVATALRLPPTVLFDHPSLDALVSFMSTQLFADRQTADSNLDQIESAIIALTNRNDTTRTKTIARLRSLLLKCELNEPDKGVSFDDSFEAASDEELFESFDRDFGGIET